MRANFIDVIDRRPELAARVLAVIIMVFLCVFSICSIFNVSSPRTYRATVNIEFQREKTPDKDRAMEPQCWTSSQSRFCLHFARTEGLSLGSDRILVRALDRLQERGKQLPNTKKRAGFPKSIEELRAALVLDTEPESNLISITATACDAKGAAQIANAVAEEYCLSAGDFVGALGLRPVIKSEARAPIKPVFIITAVRSAREGFGSALLALAAGYVLLWRAGLRQSPPISFGAFMPWFLLILSLITGVTALIPSSNLAIGVALGSWIGFVVGAATYWRTRLGSRFPIAATVFAAVFTGAFLLRVVYGVATAFLSPQWFEGTANVRLTAFDENGEEQSGGRPASAVCDPRFIQTECAIIGSTEMLGRFVGEQSLASVWGHKYRMDAPLRMEETIHLLQRKSTLAPVNGTSLLEVRVVDDSAEEAIRLAKGLAEVYSHYRNRDEPLFYYGKRVRATVVAWGNNEDVPGRSTLLIRSVFSAVLLACTAVGGAVFGVWLAGPTARRVRSWFPTLLLLVVLGLVALVLFRAFSPTVYSRSAQVSLQCRNSFEAPTGSAADYAPVYDRALLERECAFIKSLQPTRSSRLAVYPVPGTSLLAITAKSGTPEGAARAVSTLAEKYRSLRAKGLPDPANPDGLCAEIIEKASSTPHMHAEGPRHPILASVVSVIDYIFFGAAGAFVGWISIKIKTSPRLNRVILGSSTDTR